MKPRGVMMSVMLFAVSAAVAAAVSFAWFDLFRESRAENLILRSEGQAVSVDGFKLFTSDEAESTLPGGNTIKLKSYDSVFGKNSETPVYILIPVSGEAVQEEGYTLHFTFDCSDSGLVDTDQLTILNDFSNVAQLSYMVVSDPSGLTSYSVVRDLFHPEENFAQSSASEPVCFADYTVDSDTHLLQPGYSKVNPVVLSLPGYSDSGVLYVLFELDYNFKLVTGFVNNRASQFSGRLDKTQQLDFSYDMRSITVSAD